MDPEFDVIKIADALENFGINVANRFAIHAEREKILNNPEQCRLICCAVQGVEFGTRQDPIYMMRYRKRVERMLAQITGIETGTDPVYVGDEKAQQEATNQGPEPKEGKPEEEAESPPEGAAEATDEERTEGMDDPAPRAEDAQGAPEGQGDAASAEETVAAENVSKPPASRNVTSGNAPKKKATNSPKKKLPGKAASPKKDLPGKNGPGEPGQTRPKTTKKDTQTMAKKIKAQPATKKAAKKAATGKTLAKREPKSDGVIAHIVNVLQAGGGTAVQIAEKVAKKVPGKTAEGLLATVKTQMNRLKTSRGLKIKSTREEGQKETKYSI